MPRSSRDRGFASVRARDRYDGQERWWKPRHRRRPRENQGQVKITQPDGSIVYAEPDNGADLTGTSRPWTRRYLLRPVPKLAAKFAGLNCTADLTTGEVTCTDPEELQLILKTLSAHHFNFLHANAVPGVQKVEVQAMAQAAVALGGKSLGAAGAEAFAGAGALSVGIIRLVKDANGTTDLETIR